MPFIYRPAGKAYEFAHWALNPYWGCPGGCLYCYGPAACHTTPERFHGQPYARKGVLEGLAKELPAFSGTDDPILMCFIADPYQDLDIGLELTREVLKLMVAHDAPSPSSRSRATAPPGTSTSCAGPARPNSASLSPLFARATASTGSPSAAPSRAASRPSAGPTRTTSAHGFRSSPSSTPATPSRSSSTSPTSSTSSRSEDSTTTSTPRPSTGPRPGPTSSTRSSALASRTNATSKKVSEIYNGE